ncbi:Outer membrane protein OprM precursor [Anaerohalosphaera lusitana]|uniref:Outer membrane protein OprM n=2 Tax=Anaerohalosphaera lusitana TaxID=1936003 RepID=A0A1U9NIZ1_9BACT|nr:Outer membrane protein OprM precursor [Anaerohalosphaera lusitana]
MMTSRALMNSIGIRLIILVLTILLGQGCTVGPDYSHPGLLVPDKWQAELQRGLNADELDVAGWWQRYSDPTLIELVETARSKNLDVQQAFVRIAEARSALAATMGRYYPDINASGYYTRFRNSENITAIEAAGTSGDQYNIHNLGFDASWEIDVFGDIRRSVEASRAAYEATIEDFHDVLVILTADVAFNYFELLATRKRINFAEQNIILQKEMRELTKNRFDAEIAPELDVEQAELNLANTESILPTLRILETAALNRLAVLLGKNPGQIDKLLTDRTELPALPDDILVGLPVELIRHRPDIRSAERELARQVAEIGIATSELYPQFSLDGFFAFQSLDLSTLDNWGSRTYGFGPAFVWNIFDGNRIRNNIDIQKSQADQALVGYEQTLLLALEDVENAMVAYVQERERSDALQRSVTAARRSVELVSELYRNGLTDFQNVLDMQRTLFEQQDQLAQSSGQVAINSARIYKALGGWWDKDVQKAQDSQAITADGAD